MAESYFAPFNRRVTAALAARRIRAAFVDDAPEQFFQGEVHCGSQVFRDPAQVVTF